MCSQNTISIASVRKSSPSYLQLPLPLNADYQLNIRVVRYENPSHRDFHNSCCDPFCATDCDTHLRFCLRPPGHSTDTIGGYCPHELLAEEVGGDDIMFGSTAGRLPNPMSVSGVGTWLVSFHNNSDMVCGLVLDTPTDAFSTTSKSLKF